MTDIERLADLMASNGQLMAQLADNRAILANAREYLGLPDANERFGVAHMERARVRHAAILARLRSNRITALRLMGEGGSGI